ncbi:MAG: conserved rane protein of unknown function [Candidatus Saccharibacteria bacterium]|nr:conserved rane protein of unknown function [Candidatus Saccharibacteria bacterium]
MATPKPTVVKKKPVSRKKSAAQPIELSPRQKLLVPFVRLKKRTAGFLARRPHRSFRRTRRRDYMRSLQLPGYWAFTNDVRVTLWQSRQLFVWVVVVYALFSAGLVGLASQDTYTTLNETLRTTSGDILQGNWGEIGKAGLLLTSSVTGSLTTTPTEAQQIYAVLIVLLTWLTTVWLLRALKAGRKPRFRDGLYNAGAPIVSTAAVALMLIIQLIPAALAVIAFAAAMSSGFLQGGVVGMIFSVVALLFITLSVYWITSTIIALTVVTLPGMYPMQALKTAGDLVIGRRLRILLRWLWLAGLVVATWALVIIPIIIFDTWLKGILPALEWLPIVPAVLLAMSSLTIVVAAAYVYLFYRRIVEDDAAPA